MDAALVLAYYCSGHGYGHATRVSAFTRHLLSLPVPVHVHIVSSAPPLVFADSIALGASYRYAEIDPVIVQPLAYRVDRAKSVQVLQHFLDKKEALVIQESAWLTSINARGVLTDAAFLACLAASASSIPSVLLTNFTFDSVYSFLSTPLLDIPPLTSATLHHIPSLHHLPPSAPASPARLGLDHHDHQHYQHHHSLPHPTLPLPPPLKPQEDAPIPLELLRPLTQQLLDGYTHADLLVLLPGAIPIPSFPFPVNVSAKVDVNGDVDPPLNLNKVAADHIPVACSTSKLKSIKAPILPSSEWVDPHTRRTIENVERWMKAVAPLPSLELTYLSSSITTTAKDLIVSKESKRRRQRQRQVIHAPLIVRPPSGASSSSSPSSFSSSVDPQSPSPSPFQSQSPTPSPSPTPSQSQSDAEKQSPYTPEGRSALLASIGVPAHLHDHRTTRILVVSFGGQVFRCLPGSHGSHGSHSHSHGSGSHGSSRGSHGSGSRTHSRRASRGVSKEVQAVNGQEVLLGDVAASAAPPPEPDYAHAHNGVEELDAVKKSMVTAKKEAQKPKQKQNKEKEREKEIDALKPLDPNSINGVLSNKNHSYNHNEDDAMLLSAGRSQTQSLGLSGHANADVDVNGSLVPGINITIDGDIGMGASVSMVQTGKTLTLPPAGSGAGPLDSSSPLPSPPSLPLASLAPSPSPSHLSHTPSPSPSPSPSRCCPSPPQRIATPCHIWIPGAPAPVPVPFAPLPPSLVEKAGVHRRRTIAVGSSLSSSARILRMAGEGERRGCKRSASMSVKVSVSVSMSSVSRRVGNEYEREKELRIAIGKRRADNDNESERTTVIPSVVMIPPTPLSLGSSGSLASKEKDDKEEEASAFQKYDENVHERDEHQHEHEHRNEKEQKSFVVNGHGFRVPVQDQGKETGGKEKAKEEVEEYTFFEDHLEVEEEEYDEYDDEEEGSGGLVPDGSWIAIVCGMSGNKKKKTEAKEKGGEVKGNEQEEEDEDEDLLPEGFYVAPRDVYMPDLMAVADVLLGKLGYGTVSECVDACTPFIYVSRPLFIEEHGLRLLLDQEGVGIELSREAYEQGEWAVAVNEAWERGREAKEEKRRREMELVVERQQNGDGGGSSGWDKRQEEGRQLARRVVDWVKDWWEDEMRV